MLRRARILWKFENHIFRDATGTPWMDMDQWSNCKQPQPPSISNGFISQSARLVNLTFIDELGNTRRIKAEPGVNLWDLCSTHGIRTELDAVRQTVDFPDTHMVVSSPHFERLIPPNYIEDHHLNILEWNNTVHKNSRLIKFLSVTEEMEGIVIVNPLYADVWTHNMTNPFTDKIEDLDKAKSPNLHINEVNTPNRADHIFPSVTECVWKGIVTYKDLYDLTRNNFLRRQAERARNGGTLPITFENMLRLPPQTPMLGILPLAVFFSMMLTLLLMYNIEVEKEHLEK